MFEIVDGRTPEHGYIIGSPCEPNGSGKLKNSGGGGVGCGGGQVGGRGGGRSGWM